MDRLYNWVDTRRNIFLLYVGALPRPFLESVFFSFFLFLSFRFLFYFFPFSLFPFFSDDELMTSWWRADDVGDFTRALHKPNGDPAPLARSSQSPKEETCRREPVYFHKIGLIPRSAQMLMPGRSDCYWFGLVWFTTTGYDPKTLLEIHLSYLSVTHLLLVCLLGNAIGVAKHPKGRHQKKTSFLGLSPKQRTQPTHPYGLGLT